ncbi:hypothetical protein OAD19_04195, partial [Octadecabacter sp.]|nr:hypothetical protein [Octadecabacter sp.]
FGASTTVAPIFRTRTGTFGNAPFGFELIKQSIGQYGHDSLKDTIIKLPDLHVFAGIAIG